MADQVKLVNTVIDDGNRIVNWDFDPKETVRSVLTRWGFEWETDTVSVCGVLMMPENMLDHALEDYMYAPSECFQYPKRIFIKMKQPQKKEKKEKVADVG